MTQVEEIYLEMIAALTPHEIVNLLVDDEETEQPCATVVHFRGRAFVFITFKQSTRGFATMVQTF